MTKKGFFIRTNGNRWKDIIDSINIENIPAEYISEIILHAHDEKIIIDVKKITSENASEDMERIIDERINSVTDEYDVTAIDYMLDISKASEKLQELTDITLGEIKNH